MRSGRSRWLITTLATIAAIIVVIVLIWDWDWFKPIVERMASERLHRTVHIAHLAVHPGSVTTVSLDHVSISNPSDDPAGGDLAGVDTVSVALRIWPLLSGDVILPEIVIDHPVADLHGYGDDDKKNYAFTMDQKGSSSAKPPQIGALVISNGDIHFRDTPLSADFKVHLATTDAHTGEPKIHADATGTYAGQPITGHFTGGSIMSLRDTAKPYPIDLDIANGNNKVEVHGTVEDPLTFHGAKVQLVLSGDDLSTLHPLTGIPIPPTPPFRLAGGLQITLPYISFHHIDGHVGTSDLEGDLDVAPGHTRPFLTGDLTSKQVVLADLAGFIGNKPGSETEANLPPERRREKQQQEASGPLFPTTRISIPKLRAVDVKLHYHGDHIKSQDTPLDDLDAQISINDGLVKAEPIAFGIGSGHIAFNLDLDGRQDPLHATLDAKIDRVDLSRIMQSTKIFQGAGTLGGRVQVDATGESPAALVANGSGHAQTVMSGGNLSALLNDLAGLEAGRAIYRYVTRDVQTPVNCFVADLDLEQGIMMPKTFVLDTGEETLWLAGLIDLRNQTLDLKLSSRAKHFSVLSIKAPLAITGSMKSPSVQPDKAALAERGAPAAVLGVLLTPVAALLSTIELGDKSDAGCHTLLQQAKLAPPEKANAPSAR